MDLSPLFLSLRVATLATLVSLVVGLGLAWLLARRRFPGRELLSSLFILPIVLPPTVLGYYLLVALGRQSPFGRFLEEGLGLSLVFTWQAAVIASAVVSFPLLFRSALAALESIDPNLENVARTLGKGELTIIWSVTLPLAWQGILAGVLLAFARAMGEFGATLMVAGNIPGRTQTLPIAIYDAVQAGEMALANALVLIVTAATLAALVVLSTLGRAARW